MSSHFAKFAVLAVVVFGFLILPAGSFAVEGSAVRGVPAVSVAGPSCPAAPAVAAPSGSEPTFLAARWCCLAEWQPGPCASNQYYASLCTNACGTCGAFSCISKTTSCLK